MEKTNINSNEIKKDFIDLFHSLFKKNNMNYELTVAQTANVICSASEKRKEERKMMMSYLLSKSIEINNYRKSMGMINPNSDDYSLHILQTIEDGTGNITINRHNLQFMINDVLYYLLYTNKLYQQLAIEEAMKSGIHKKIYKISPFSLIDHIQINMETDSDKKILLEQIENAITYSFDRLQLASNMHPNPTTKNLLLRKKHYSTSFYISILNQFNTDAVIREEKSNSKVLICELVYSILCQKEKKNNLTFIEKNLLERIKSCSKTQEELSKLYDSYSLEIVYIFTKNLTFIESTEKTILKDQPEFSKAKEKIKK